MLSQILYRHGVYYNRILTKFAVGTVASLCILVSAQSVYAQTATPVLVKPGNVGGILAPGDFLFKYKDSSNNSDGVVMRGFGAAIAAGQAVLKAGTKEWNERVASEGTKFSQGLAKGDANAIHVAIYIGNGVLAEANGAPLTASVTRWNLFTDHKGETWRVFRLKNREIADAVSKVAGTWATGRMKYLIPAQVMVTNSTFGPKAKADGLQYAEAYSSAGGPPAWSKMFCSQFAVSVAQSAAIKVLLVPKTPKLTVDSLEALPTEYKMDAMSSPVTVFGVWEKSGAFQIFGPIVIE